MTEQKCRRIIAITRRNSLEDDPKAGIEMDVNTADTGEMTVVLLIVQRMKFGHGLEMRKLIAAAGSMSRRTVGGTSASSIANRAAGIAVRANGLKEISAAVSANSKAMEIATRVRINGLELVGLIVARSHDAITEVRSANASYSSHQNPDHFYNQGENQGGSDGRSTRTRSTSM